jgi:hypothetical protein
MSSFTRQPLIRAWRAFRQTSGTPGAAITTPPPPLIRPFSSSTTAETPLPDPTSPGIVEMRQYTISPSGIKDYLNLTNQSAAVRTRHLPLVGFFQPELGGDLTTVTHFYAYLQGLDERAERRKGAANDPEWQKYVSESRAFVKKQKNAALVEWPTLYGASGGDWSSAREFAERSRKSNSPGGSIYEMRTYRLSATASVRKLVRAFEEGLPAKAEAAAKELGGSTTDHQQLALFGSVEVGKLDMVVELWRYDSAEACARARRAARLAPTWKRAVSSVATGVSEFKVQLLTPFLPMSPMR